MISSCNSMPNMEAEDAPSPPAAQPLCPNNQEPMTPPAKPVKNGWRWKKLPPPKAGAGAAGAKPGGRDGCGSGVTLRLSGCAPLLSYVRKPRLPMLEEWPPAELPARASAIAGANARVAAIRTASKMRQFSIRFDMIRSSKSSRAQLEYARYGHAPIVAEASLAAAERFLGEGRLRRVPAARVRGPSCLIAGFAGPKYSGRCMLSDGCRT